jgi:hypothetical protein
MNKNREDGPTNPRILAGKAGKKMNRRARPIVKIPTVNKPSEAAIVQIKKEGRLSGYDDVFADAIYTLLHQPTRFCLLVVRFPDWEMLGGKSNCCGDPN